MIAGETTLHKRPEDMNDLEVNNRLRFKIPVSNKDLPFLSFY